MTNQKHLKSRVRARMARTGESYASARAHVVADGGSSSTAADVATADASAGTAGRRTASTPRPRRSGRWRRVPASRSRRSWPSWPAAGSVPEPSSSTTRTSRACTWPGRARSTRTPASCGRGLERLGLSVRRRRDQWRGGGPAQPRGGSAARSGDRVVRLRHARDAWDPAGDGRRRLSRRGGPLGRRGRRDRDDRRFAGDRDDRPRSPGRRPGPDRQGPQSRDLGDRSRRRRRPGRRNGSGLRAMVRRAPEPADELVRARGVRSAGRSADLRPGSRGPGRRVPAGPAAVGRAPLGVRVRRDTTGPVAA